MCDFNKDKEQKRKSWNKRKVENIQKNKHFVFNPSMVVSKEEGTKIYLELMRDHAKTLNQKISVFLNDQRYVIHPNGRIYNDKENLRKQKDLNDF